MKILPLCCRIFGRSCTQLYPANDTIGERGGYQGRGQRSAQSPQEGCPPATRAKSGVILESVARPRLWKVAGVGVADTEKGAVASVQLSTGALTVPRACATEAFVSVSWRSVEGIARGPESVGAPRKLSQGKQPFAFTRAGRLSDWPTVRSQALPTRQGDPAHEPCGGVWRVWRRR
eukprot:COSAG06_NODE_1053_length_10949_cov_15.790968_8_plen_176_part_00